MNNDMENSMQGGDRSQDFVKMQQKVETDTARILGNDAIKERVISKIGKNPTRGQLERFLRDEEFEDIRNGREPKKFSKEEVDALFRELNPESANTGN